MIYIYIEEIQLNNYRGHSRKTNDLWKDILIIYLENSELIVSYAILYIKQCFLYHYAAIKSFCWHMQYRNVDQK